ncbi:MAG TPA: hypothetical protein PKW33_07985 [Anaerolineaceae bacterium]|nr:hypothetical protein [Anaerolineaceae bacterium]HPN51513.1 hypothetical protein [Anaerolineaceae bacterium]
MRITRDTLLKNARTFVAQRIRSDMDLVAVYVVGSLLTAEPLLGGTTDIDLVFIHAQDVYTPREVIRISPEVSFDIAHFSQNQFYQPRHLRQHPWIGPSIYASRIALHDLQHWFEFNQASISAQFLRPENVAERARQFEEQARDLWMELQGQEPTPETVYAFLKAAGLAANAIACLDGPPLTDRRFLLDLPPRMEASGSAGLTTGFLGLLGANQADPEEMRAWLPAWKDALKAVALLPECPVNLKSPRLLYHSAGVEALLGGDLPAAALWPLLRTWTRALLPAEMAAHLPAWQESCARLGLNGGAFGEKIDALDAYLDTIEEALDAWEKRNGISR